MPKKAKLIQVDEERWALAKTRAASLRIPLNDFIEQAIDAHIVTTASASASNINTFYASSVANLSGSDHLSGSDTTNNMVRSSQVIATDASDDRPTFTTTSDVEAIVTRMLGGAILPTPRKKR